MHEYRLMAYLLNHMTRTTMETAMIRTNTTIDPATLATRAKSSGEPEPRG